MPRTAAAVRRAARYGDGYFPWVAPGLDLHATLGEVIPAVRAEAEKLGRDPQSIEMTVGGARTVAEASTRLGGAVTARTRVSRWFDAAYGDGA